MLNSIAVGVYHYAYKLLLTILEVLLIIQQENVCKYVLLTQITIQITQLVDVFIIVRNFH